MQNFRIKCMESRKLLHWVFLKFKNKNSINKGKYKKILFLYSAYSLNLSLKY